jgi:hypothetical protein
MQGMVARYCMLPRPIDPRSAFFTKMLYDDGRRQNGITRVNTLTE